MAVPTGSTFPCLKHPSFFLRGFHSSTKNFPSARKVVRPLNSIPSSEIFEPEVSRRRANFKPNIWDHDLLQSLRSDYEDEAYAKRAEKLKEEIKCLLQEAANPLAQLEMIDAFECLGLGHIFEKNIKEILNTMWVSHNSNENKGGIESNDLYATSLLFRLLRKHGYYVSQDVFNKFMDEKGGLITRVIEDINGILSLYEASHLAYQRETLLSECRTFTRMYLRAFKGSGDMILANKVEHALELPMHWRMGRMEALWHLDIYESAENKNPYLLELAKLDFNMVQATHQRDLTEASRWWSRLGLGGKLSFSRDRIMESFFLALGVMFEPQFGYPRVELAKVFQLITTIDDIYDVFGSLDELECFTDVVDRWDIKSIDRLPEYMKICFLALFNTANEMGYEILKDQRINIIPYLQRVWTDLCKAMLVESSWYYSGYKPSLEEYLNNAWVTSSGPVLLVHAFLLSKQPISTQVWDGLDKNLGLIKWPSMIFRLCNDLATSKDEKVRGDAPSSIDCYMKEANVSEMDARNQVRDLIFDSWKKLNEEVRTASPYPPHFINSALNLARVVHCIYQHGDSHTVQDRNTKDRLTSLLKSFLSVCPKLEIHDFFKWDIKSIDRLPEYMKQICFLALFNTANEMGYEILKDQGINIIPYLQKVWTDCSKAMLVESNWYYSGYKPCLHEYLNNGWVSSSGPVILVHAFLLSKRPISTQVLDGLDRNPALIRWPSMIFRLCNDLATYKDEKVRGDAPSSIDCYMKEANVSVMDACNHVQDLIFDSLKKLKEDVRTASPYPPHFINNALNLARVVRCMCQHCDGHTVQDRNTKDLLTSLLVQPIPLNVK